MPSLNEYADELNATLKGFLTPVFEERDAHSGRIVRAMFTADDVRKLMQGYACPECLAEFRTYLVRCPACNYVRADVNVQNAPEEWLQHLRDRQERGEPKVEVPIQYDAATRFI